MPIGHAAAQSWPLIRHTLTAGFATRSAGISALSRFNAVGSTLPSYALDDNIIGRLIGFSAAIPGCMSGRER